MKNVTHHKVSLGMRLRVRIRRQRLGYALAAAIAIAIVLVAISVNIYTLAGFSRYDLSRPGYEKERKEVAKPAPTKTYDTTGTITTQVIDEFLTEYDTRTKDTAAFGNFRDSSLNDNELGVNDDSATQPTGDINNARP